MTAGTCPRDPYPGLRSFRRDETDLFFGREICINDMVDRLAETRFLAVVGSSGTGKSSLVKTGLIDGLELGFMENVGSLWRVVELRPSGTPLRNLAAALVEFHQSGIGSGLSLTEEIDDMVDRLRHQSLGLINWFRAGHIPVGTNLLLVIDQFEELFRNMDGEGREEVESFVALLLESSHPSEVERPRMAEFPIYVTITMRSEFLGACALIDGLADAINAGMYLTPRMTRAQCRDAIVEPAKVCGIKLDPRLVNRLLNDLAIFAPWAAEADHKGRTSTRSSVELLNEIGRRADQLPLLQYTLNRTLAVAREARKPPLTLTIDDYEEVGALEYALNNHADKIFKALGENFTVEMVFRALTERTSIGDAVRRPARFDELVAICHGNEGAVRKVVQRFRSPDCNFLIGEIGGREHEQLDPNIVISIRHESLIRQWSKFPNWLREEALSRERLLRLNEAYINYPKSQKLLEERELQTVFYGWNNDKALNRDWARRYLGNEIATDPDHFTKLMAFLSDSRKLTQGTEEERREYAIEFIRHLEQGGRSDLAADLAKAISQLGNWLRHLGRHREAERQLAETVEIRRGIMQTGGSAEAAAELARALYQHALTKRDLGDTKAALDRLADAVAILRQPVETGGSAQFVEALTTLVIDFGQLLKSADRLMDAEQELRDLVVIVWRLVEGGRSDLTPYLSRAMVEYSDLLSLIGRNDAAEQQLRELINVTRRLAEQTGSPVFDDQLAKAGTACAELLHRLKRREEAEELLREVVAIRRRLANEYHGSEAEYELCSALYNHGFALTQLNKLPEALPALEAAITINQRLVEQSGRADLTEQLKRATDVYIQSLETLGRLTEAEAHLRGAFDNHLRLVKEEGRANLAGALVTDAGNYSKLLLVVERYEEAEQLLAEVLAVLRGLVHEQGRTELQGELATAVGNYGDILSKLGRYRDAEPNLRETVAIRRAIVGSSDRPETVIPLAVALSSHGAALRELHRPEALHDFEEAVAIIQKVVRLRKDLSGELARVLGDYADLLQRFDRHADAEAKFAEVVAIRRNLATKGNIPALVALAIALDNHGLLLRRLRRVEEASQYLSEAVDIILRLVKQEGHADLAARLATTVNNYSDLPRTLELWAQAEEYLRGALTANNYSAPPWALELWAQAEEYLRGAVTVNNYSDPPWALEIRAQAEEYLREAITIIRPLVEQEGRDDLAGYLVALSNTYAQLLHALKRSAEAAQQLSELAATFRRLTKDQGRVRLKSALADAILYYGDLLRIMGQPTEAEQNTREAVEIRRDLATNDNRLELKASLALALYLHGLAVESTALISIPLYFNNFEIQAFKRRKQAVQALSEAAERFQQLIDEGQVSLRHELARTLYHCGRVQWGRYRRKNAEEQLAESVALFSPLIEQGRSDFINETVKAVRLYVFMLRERGRTRQAYEQLVKVEGTIRHLSDAEEQTWLATALGQIRKTLDRNESWHRRGNIFLGLTLAIGIIAVGSLWDAAKQQRNQTISSLTAIESLLRRNGSADNSAEDSSNDLARLNYLVTRLEELADEQLKGDDVAAASRSYKAAMAVVNRAIEITRLMFAESEDAIRARRKEALVLALGRGSRMGVLAGQPLSAAEDGEQALALDPSQIWITINLGHAYLLTDRFDDAVDLYRKAKKTPKPSEHTKTYGDDIRSDLNLLRKLGLATPELIERVKESVGI